MAFAVEIEAQSVSQQARLDGFSDDFDARSADRKVLEDTLARREQLVGPYISAAHSLWDTPRPSVLRATLQRRRRGTRAAEAQEIPKRVEKWHHESSAKDAVRTKMR